jgi:hypothetical protein
MEVRDVIFGIIENYGQNKGLLWLKINIEKLGSEVTCEQPQSVA